MNSECKNYSMKEFRAIFSISSILVIRSGYAKKDNFSILADRISGNDFGQQVRVCKRRYFKMYGIYKNLGCRLNLEHKNYPMKEFRAIFFISLILVIRSAYAKKDHFSILAVIQNIWDLHIFGLQIWIQNAKITLWKNFGQFFRYHRFWSSGPGMQKKIIFQY